MAFPHSTGKQLKNREELAAYVNSVLLPRAILHPSIVKVCWSAFMRGDYDNSVFLAFKELEVAIREAGKFTAEDYGVDLAGKAFHEVLVRSPTKQSRCRNALLYRTSWQVLQVRIRPS